MSHERDQTQEAMEDEMRDLLEAAKKRPITEDESYMLLWHMGYAIRKQENRA